MSIVTASSDADFERRWRTWIKRGLAHERAVRRRFVISAILIVVAGLVVLIAWRPALPGIW